MTETDTVINHILAHPPAAGHQITFVRLGSTQSIELEALYELSGRLACVLSEQGIGRGDRIGILASNGLDWVLLDLAALRIGAITVGFDPAKFDAPKNLIDRYKLAAIFTDDEFNYPEIRQVSELRQSAVNHTGDIPIIRYSPEDVTTLKLTSGSTGEPKGLTASVGSIDNSIRAVQQLFRHGSDDNLFVFLPLSILQQRYWIYSALRYGHNVTVSTYQAAYAILGNIQPTVVMGVPGFYEMARQRIKRLAGGSQQRSVDESQLRAAAIRVFGNQIRYLWTGSAPASPDLLNFYEAINIPIFEGYGLNETCIVTKNHPGANRPGSVGRVLPGKQVLLDSDGVITVRADIPVCHRYEYAADGESDRVFGPDGVVRTGDLGHFDADGYLYIDGRADEAIVLPNGRKILVRHIEERIKASPIITECVVFCPDQTNLIAVLSPAQGPVDMREVRDLVAAANITARRDERISRIVVGDQFSIENGLLTSQFKPKRGEIFRRYQSAIIASEGSIDAQDN